MQNNNIKQIYGALILGIKDYFKKNKFEKAVIGLSGGIDSALSAKLVADAIGKENVKALIMPVKGLNSEENIMDAVEFCTLNGIDYSLVYINDFIKEFETSMNIKEKPEKFRSHLISSLGAYSLDHPGLKIKYTTVFPDLVKNLQESFREEQKKMIVKMSQNLVFFIAEQEAKRKGEDHQEISLTEENRKKIEQLVNNLIDKFGYTNTGALNLLKRLIKDRY